MLPAGPKIALTGGLAFNDHVLIWERLDQVRAKHPDMVLLHGGSPRGAELSALVTRFLTREGFSVRWVSGGTAGIEQALGEDYSLILLDVMIGDEFFGCRA